MASSSANLSPGSEALIEYAHDLRDSVLNYLHGSTVRVHERRRPGDIQSSSAHTDTLDNESDSKETTPDAEGYDAPFEHKEHVSKTLMKLKSALADLEVALGVDSDREHSLSAPTSKTYQSAEENLDSTDAAIQLLKESLLKLAERNGMEAGDSFIINKGVYDGSAPHTNSELESKELDIAVSEFTPPPAEQFLQSLIPTQDSTVQASVRFEAVDDSAARIDDAIANFENDSDCNKSDVVATVPRYLQSKHAWNSSDAITCGEASQAVEGTPSGSVARRNADKDQMQQEQKSRSRSLSNQTVREAETALASIKDKAQKLIESLQIT